MLVWVKIIMLISHCVPTRVYSFEEVKFQFLNYKSGVSLQQHFDRILFL